MQPSAILQCFTRDLVGSFHRAMRRTPHTKFVRAYPRLCPKDLSWTFCTFLAIFLAALITLALPTHQLRAQSQDLQKSPTADSQKPPADSQSSQSSEAEAQKPPADSQSTQSSNATPAKPPADSQVIQSSDAGPIKPPPEHEAPAPTPATQPPPDATVAPAQPDHETTSSPTAALQSAGKKKPKAYKVDVELTLVPVSVTDPYGRMVTGLDQENFRIFEDNKEQEIARFSSEDVPISIGVIFDMSSSMADKFEKSRLAAVQFFKTANPEDEFCLVNFNDRAQLVSSFTASVEDLQERLMYTAAHGETALFDGIYLGLSQMKGARNSKKALLIISDGGDNHSRYSEMDVRKFVKEADVQIFAIGIFDKGDYKSLEEQNGPALLGEITELTGGRVFRVNSLKDLPDVATKISMELRNQYVLGYRPTNQLRDGKWRKIKIRLRPPKGLPPLQVYSRTGYYAPGH